MTRHATSPCIYRDLAHAEGYCCTYHYTVALAHAPASRMGKALGVNENTILYWRNKVKKGEALRCEKCPSEIAEHAAVKAFKSERLLRDYTEGR